MTIMFIQVKSNLRLNVLFKKKTRMVTYPNLPTCCAQNEKHIPCYNNKIPNYTLIRIKLHHEHTVMSIILKPHQVFNES